MSQGESPQATQPALGARIEYFRAYQAAVASPQWMVNLLWGMLAVFSSNVIPFLGAIVWTGYTYECVETWLATRGKTLADFDVNRFGDYLVRGVWPFLIQMVLWFALFVAYLSVYGGGIVIALIADAVGEEYATIVLAVAIPLFALTLGTALVLLLVVLSPVMLRAGLAQDMTIALRLAWCRDFLRRVGFELLLTTLFVVVTGGLLMSLGCACLFVGSYVAWPYVTLASAHLAWQLYELHLSRGGEPIPLKPRRVIPPPVRTVDYGLPGYRPADKQPSPPDAV